MMNSEKYLHGIIKQFEYYKSLGEKTMHQLSEEQLFWQYNEASNSIAMITKHLWGNMLSRWTRFLIEDGEKAWRKRDQEFENNFENKDELLKKWEEGWTCLFAALESVSNSNINQLVYIRNIGHTIPEAINRQLAHYAYHIGQMVFIGKMIANDQWKSLSIPKGLSAAYNQKRFAEAKHKGHYTDNLLKDE